MRMIHSGRFIVYRTGEEDRFLRFTKVDGKAALVDLYSINSVEENMDGTLTITVDNKMSYAVQASVQEFVEMLTLLEEEHEFQSHVN